MKDVIKNEWKFCISILLAGLLLYIAGYITAYVTLEVKVEKAIAALLVKQPKTLKQYEGHKFHGNVFIDCIKNQTTVKSSNTEHCLSVSAYKP